MIRKIIKKLKNSKPEISSNNTRFLDDQILNIRGNLENEFPSDYQINEINLIKKSSAFTMTSVDRQIGLLRALDYIIQNNIKGDIVECGVWKGGSMMLVANRLMELGKTEKNLFLYDTFEGMAEPNIQDVDIYNKEALSIFKPEQEKWCYSALEEVKSNLESTKYPSKNIYYEKGKVEDTLPNNSISEISLLRLDTDWYESTKVEMNYLFPKLTKGGVLIIDDYGHWQGAKKAIDEYIQENNICIFFNRMDYTGRLGIKI